MGTASFTRSRVARATTGARASDGGEFDRQTLQPPSTTLIVPVVKADSSLAR